MYKKFKRFFSLFLAMSIAIICLPTLAYAANNTIATLSDGYYTIKALVNGKYVDANSSIIQIYDRNEKRAQAFSISKVGNYWKILVDSSNKAISVEDSSYEDRAVLVQQDYTGESNQLWTIIANSDKSFSFVNKNSGKYMDVYNGDSANGTKLIQFYSHGGINQKFELQKVNQDPNNQNIDDSDEVEVIYGDDDEEITDIQIINHTEFDFEGLDLDELPVNGKKYLAQVTYLDTEEVLEKLANKNSIPASEYKKLYSIAHDGKKSGVNMLIRKVYVTFDVTYSYNKVSIRASSTRTFAYVKWTKNNASKTSKQMQPWTIVTI